MAFTELSPLGFGVPIEWLAFFLVFAAVYGIITSVGKKQGTPLFGNNGVNTVIAVVFALFAAGNSAFISFFQNNFIIVVWTFVILFFLSFVLEVFGLRKAMSDRKSMKEAPHRWISIGALTILLFLTVGISAISNIDIPVIGTNNALMILGLVFFAQMVLYALSVEESGGGKGG